MSNYHMNMEAMRKYQSEKAKLMDEIFGYRIHGGAKPTYNLTSHKLSDTITHEFKANPYDYDYVSEKKYIVYSCENNTFVDNRWCKGFYIFVEDLDISVLKAIKYEIGNTSYYDWLKGKKDNEEKRINEIKAPLMKEIEDKDAEIARLKAKIGAVTDFLRN